MSAPQTNIEKQEQRHKGPLTGMAGVLLFAGALLVGLIVWTVYNGNDPRDPAVKVDGRTGAEVVVTD